MTSLLALQVLIIAGGGSPERNFHSHLVHVQALRALLLERGVEPARIHVFWADGADPGVDRAVRRGPAAPTEWVIERSFLDRGRPPGLSLEDTRFEHPVQPATRAAIRKTLAGLDDAPLLIAVTDHGRREHIVLWGEEWSAAELSEDLQLASGPVKLWFSQCYSGSFIDVTERPETCAVFSANPDEPAYGCYPELGAETQIGHFARMVDGLAATGSLGAASDLASATDTTPDVPHRSSEAVLYGAVAARAEGLGRSVADQVDAVLGQPALAHLLRDLQAVEVLTRRLKRWQRAYASAVGAGRTRALVEHETAEAALAAIPPDVLEMRRRIIALRGVLLRLSTQKARLRRRGYGLLRQTASALEVTPETRARVAALERCESAPLFEGSGAKLAPAGPPEPPAPEEVRALEPGWLGVGYEETPQGVRITRGRGTLKKGAVVLRIGGAALGPGDFRRKVMLARPGSPLHLSLRGGRQLSLPVRGPAGPRKGPPKQRLRPGR